MRWKKVDPWADEVGNEKYFLPRDTFEMTKEERYLQSLLPKDQEE